jgi:hypothetical protein
MRFLQLQSPAWWCFLAPVLAYGFVVLFLELHGPMVFVGLLAAGIFAYTRIHKER